MADLQRIEDLRRRVQRDPASIAFAQLAEELRRIGELEEAADICRAGLEQHPAYLSAHVTLGRTLVELGQLDDARKEFEFVLQGAPENLAAIRGLADIFHRQGFLPEALAQYRRALGLARNDPDLERAVADLAREIEPSGPVVVPDGLSFEQARHELLKHAPPPPAAASAAQVVPPPEAPFPAAAALPDVAVPPDDARPAADPAHAAAARRTIAALEHWLAAIDVARADRRA